ncbi:MAG: response regulator [Alphaproteobacteria bacterium]|nr:response regulator [Alphaproteobacteria bacterium]
MRDHRVLLIEDNDVDAAIFTRCVEAMPGYQVVRVRSLEQAEETVERLGGAWFDLVAVDLTLPDAMDLEAIHFARTQIPQAVCVAVTARDPDEVDERALRAGAADLLEKGRMNLRGIQRAISHAIERNELVRRQLESERNLRSVLAAWSEALYVVDEDRQVVFSNDAAAALAPGVLDTEPGPRLRLDLRPGDVLQTDVRLPGGETVPAEARAWGITWADRPATVVVLRDIRAERAAERTRALAELGRGALKGVHDIGNRVTALRASIADARATLPAVAREAAPTLEATLERMERSVEQIAHVVRSSREDATKVRARRLVVDLGALVRSCCQDLRAALEADADLRLQLHPRVEVLGDPADLTRVVDNLLRNAAEALAEAPEGDHEIRVQVSLVDGDAVLEVEDTGPGIPAHLRDHLFDEGVTGKVQGTGLGLASVRRVVEAHAGTVEVRSEPGAGACFRVRLPARGPSLAGIRVLLLEDQADVARANERLLGERYRVSVVHDGAAGLELLADDDDFHVLLCDLDMPGLDGRAFFEHLQVAHPALTERVVFCSGGAATSELEDFLASTARPVLHKPLDLGHAIQTIEDVASRTVGAA